MAMQAWAGVTVLLAACIAAGCSQSDSEPVPTPGQVGGEEQAVLVHLPGQPLDDDLFALEDELSEAIETARVGEFDGDEVGGGEATLYMYGPDADALWDIAEPVVRRFRLNPGAYAVVRHGPPGTDETRIDLP